MRTSVHVFETTGIVNVKIWQYFHPDDQSIWSSVTPKLHKCITIKKYIEYSRNDIIALMTDVMAC